MQDWALDLPREFSSRKKLTPRSASFTMASSTMAKRPIPGVKANGSAWIQKAAVQGTTLPGSTRFLRASTPTVPEPVLKSRMFADSRAA